ncbi:MAG: hypothetical protein KJN90_00170, partial [Gammaproteobacteria bacterium]|nr:hypothetical protein [Gammaproteobacteria bacterium]
LQDHAQSLDLLDSRLRRALHWHIQQRKNNLRELQRTLLSNTPRQRLNNLRNNQASLYLRLTSALQGKLRDRSSTLDQLIRSLNAVSPLNTLARGFSITTRQDGRVLQNSNDVKPGDLITTRLHEGIVESKVQQNQHSETVVSKEN